MPAIGIKMLVRALVAIAKSELSKANDNREESSDWPAGQSWGDLGNSSQSAFMRTARDIAGIDHDEYRNLIIENDSDELDDLWTELEKNPS